MSRKATSAAGAARRKRAPSQPPSGPARFAEGSASTSADVIYRKLHAAIACMTLRPGTAISETRLAEEYGVSRTPVREAILRLAKERLVEIVPKSGTFVGRIPVSALIEALIARRALEAVTIRRAAEIATRAQILEFRAILERQRDVAESGDLALFHRTDEAFHEFIAQVADYQGIWNLIRQVKLQVDRYRQLTLPQEGRMSLVIAEHTAVIDAIEASNPDAAVAAMDRHLDKLELDLEVFGELWPEYFIHDRAIDA